MSAMQRNTLTAFDIALYGAVVFAWGFSWIALHYQVGVVAPEISVMWRFALAAPVMLACAFLRGERLFFPPGDHARFAALGLMIFSTNFVLFYYGGQHLASGLLAVVFSLASIVNVWLGWLVLRAPIDTRVVTGGLLGVLGVASMFYPQLVGTTFSHDVLLGFVFCVFGTLLFCSGNMVSALLQRRNIPVFAASGYGMLYGAAGLAVYAALRGLPFAIDPTVKYVGGLVWLALVSSVLAFGSYLTLLGRIGADRAGYSTVMFPVVALAVSTFAEGYHWTLPAIAGLIAVMGGNLLVLRRSRNADHSAA
ncbi:MAG TPA: DMT family transporter [Pseudorhodoplanes sp.]|nr:DMT family transporter [Pseudorhodoplanes sp.]